MFLEVLGDPWFSPERSRYCYFIGFKWFSEISCFLMFFLYIFKSDVVFIKIRKHIVFILILEGRNVAISLVVAMILELTCFSTCVFNEFLLRF